MIQESQPRNVHLRYTLSKWRKATNLVLAVKKEKEIRYDYENQEEEEHLNVEMANKTKY